MKAPVAFLPPLPQPPSLPPRSHRLLPRTLSGSGGKAPARQPPAFLHAGNELERLRKAPAPAAACWWHDRGQGGVTGAEAALLLFCHLGKNKAELVGTKGILLGNTPELPRAAPAPGCPARTLLPRMGRCWGRFGGATATGREFNTLIPSGEDFGLLALEKEDKGRHETRLQTFKGKL